MPTILQCRSGRVDSSPSNHPGCATACQINPSEVTGRHPCLVSTYKTISGFTYSLTPHPPGIPEYKPHSGFTPLPMPPLVPLPQVQALSSFPAPPAALAGWRHSPISPPGDIYISLNENLSDESSSYRVTHCNTFPGSVNMGAVSTQSWWLAPERPESFPLGPPNP